MPVVRALQELCIPYYVGGSVASSAHGTPRASLDVDIVVAMEPDHVDGLLTALGDRYYATREGMLRAIAARRSFQAIHLATMFKVDVFVSKGRAYDEAAFGRAQSELFEEGLPPVLVATKEDTVLAKLEWFQKGHEVSERQWSDVLGVIGVHRDLDLDYLWQWAPDLGVASLLERALAEGRR